MGQQAEGTTFSLEPAAHWARPRYYALALAVVLHASLLAWAARVPLPTQASPLPTRVQVVLLGAAAAAEGGASSPPVNGHTPLAPAPPREPRVHPEPPRRAPKEKKQRSRTAPRAARPAQLAAEPLPVVGEGREEAASQPGAAAVEDGSEPTSGQGAAPGPSGGGRAGPGLGTGGAGLGNARAYCAFCPPPRYPMLARQRNWSGVVVVTLGLDSDGRVHEAFVERSSGYELLDREAIEAARASRFRLPPGLSPPIRGRIQYRFELTE